MKRESPGHTLMEVMVATVLVAILVLGFAGMLAMLEQQFYRLTLRQKAIFLLQGELERLVTLYQQEYLYYRPATFADDGQRFGRWLYREHPPGVKCPQNDANCFLVTRSFDSTVTKAGWADGQILFLDYDTRSNSSQETNLLWLDRERNITARLHWTLGDMQDPTGNSCCQTLELTLSYPYRFVEGVTPWQASMGATDTLTERTLVCGKIPFPAPVARTGANSNSVATSVNDGEDGDLQRGIPWPSPRFATNANGTVTDNLTGLMWTRDADCWGALAWGNGSDLASRLANLNSQQGGCAGYTGNFTDWHLGNSRELLSLVDQGNVWLRSPVPPDFLPVGHPFQNLTLGRYQSNTLMNDYWGDNHFSVLFKQATTVYTGAASPMGRDSGTNEQDPHWPARIQPSTDACAYPAPVPQTGNAKRTDEWPSLQDSGVKAGVAWPNPRFRDNGDDTVTDTLTGLMWSRDANLGNDCTGPDTGSDPDGVDCFSNNPPLDSGMERRADAYASIAQCNSQALAGYRDWRLPHVKELESLLHFGVNPFVYSHPFQLPNNFSMYSDTAFASFSCYPYLTSTTAPEDTGGGGNPLGFNYSRRVDLLVTFGMAKSIIKAYQGYVWAVRGGP